MERRKYGSLFPSFQCATEELEAGIVEDECLEVVHTTEQGSERVRLLTVDVNVTQVELSYAFMRDGDEEAHPWHMLDPFSDRIY